MNAYYDTGVLLPFYVKEVFSDCVLTFAENRREGIPFNLFQQLELETAIRLKRFRGEMDEAQMEAAIANRNADVRSGRLVMRPVNWVNAMEEARRIGARVTTKAGCRTLDLLHVAIAAQWASAVFVTADDRQLQAARSAGLRTVDVRTLPRAYRPGGAPPAAPPGAVRERRACYGVKVKRKRRPHGT
jgi:predicted nucleic acid-binding protein